MYGYAGFVEGVRSGSVAASTGLNAECDAIAACVIGGVSFVGGTGKISGVIINIDAEKQAEQALQDRAERDSLTKLLNKNAAKKQIEDYLSHFRGKAQCAMLIIDLDNFKQVNDQQGHLFGDAVLTKVAREIEKLFRNQDIVSRIGGDEFLVLMRTISERPLLENRCRRLLENLQTLFSKQSFKLPLSCSIGIALAPEHGTYGSPHRSGRQADRPA